MMLNAKHQCLRYGYRVRWDKTVCNENTETGKKGWFPMKYRNELMNENENCVADHDEA